MSIKVTWNDSQQPNTTNLEKPDIFQDFSCVCWTEEQRLVAGRVDAFRLKGHEFNSHSSHHIGTLGKSFAHSCLWRFGVKLQHSICAVSGAPLSSSGFVEPE